MFSSESVSSGNIKGDRFGDKLSFGLAVSCDEFARDVLHLSLF